jgi:hypothetical protein
MSTGIPKLPRVLEHLLRVIRGLHLGIDLQDLSLLVDQARDPFRVSRLRIVASSISETELAVGVTEQREGEVELLREGRVVRFGVEARPEDRDVLVDKLAGSVTEPVALDGSAGGVGFGVEPEEHFLAAEVAERDGLAFVAADREIGCELAGSQHRKPPLPHDVFAAALL